jgi:hypothetical protein
MTLDGRSCRAWLLNACFVRQVERPRKCAGNGWTAHTQSARPKSRELLGVAPPVDPGALLQWSFDLGEHGVRPFKVRLGLNVRSRCLAYRPAREEGPRQSQQHRVRV